MRVGFGLPQAGDIATPWFATQVARRAEDIGYDSLWVFERLLRPVAPRNPYPASPTGRLPEHMARTLEPLSTLAFVAGQTSTIALGTSVLIAPLHNPVVLAKQLATIDVLSQGRLVVGLGLGWSDDEFEAAGADGRSRGARFEEFLAVLKAVWTDDEPEYTGEHYRLARSVMGPRPVRAPHPPLYLGAFDERALRRVGRQADGWNPAGVPAAHLAPMMSVARAAAADAGRDPASLELVVRANVVLTDAPAGADRPPFLGSWDQLMSDVREVHAAGAQELFFDCTVADTPSESRFLDLLERFLPAVRAITG
ncbi:TIGR03619 family F420-dependent LLM class oxidoreductase [Actinokineospora sp. 24-640]